MINQLVIQIIIEDKNLPSKMHGSFLVKLLRFCISSTEEAKMKKKTIYVVIAIAVVAILAIGFQTAPKTPAFDFESNPIVDVVTTYATDPTDSYNRTVRWPNQAQIDELQSRLISLSGTKKQKNLVMHLLWHLSKLGCMMEAVSIFKVKTMAPYNSFANHLPKL